MSRLFRHLSILILQFPFLLKGMLCWISLFLVFIRSASKFSGKDNLKRFIYLNAEQVYGIQLTAETCEFYSGSLLFRKIRP